MKQATKKLRIAIFDLTDCEGCELQFLAFREDLLKEGEDLEIVNWRLGSTRAEKGPFDVAFIEGSPITESDIETVKQLRKNSAKVITLGTCAALGGVQASLSEKKREEQLKQVYGPKYKSKGKFPKPISYYINVDIHLPGCPINPTELKRLLSALHLGKKFTANYYPVCLECKANNNPCLFLEDGLCLGPVTAGGCDALCPSRGLRCYGCLGPLKGGNLPALKKNDKTNAKELEQNVALFFSQTDEFKEFKIKGK